MSGFSEFFCKNGGLKYEARRSRNRDVGRTLTLGNWSMHRFSGRILIWVKHDFSIGFAVSYAICILVDIRYHQHTAAKQSFRRKQGSNNV